MCCSVGGGVWGGEKIREGRTRLNGVAWKPAKPAKMSILNVWRSSLTSCPVLVVYLFSMRGRQGLVRDGNGGGRSLLQYCPSIVRRGTGDSSPALLKRQNPFPAQMKLCDSDFWMSTSGLVSRLGEELLFDSPRVLLLVARSCAQIARPLSRGTLPARHAAAVVVPAPTSHRRPRAWRPSRLPPWCTPRLRLPPNTIQPLPLSLLVYLSFCPQPAGNAVKPTRPRHDPRLCAGGYSPAGAPASHRRARRTGMCRVAHRPTAWGRPCRERPPPPSASRVASAGGGVGVGGWRRRRCH